MPASALLYRPQQYGELMATVRRVLPRTGPDLEVTVEGVAQLFTRPKLEAMREAGVTRVSLGVQQFDPELLGLSGRKQDRNHVLRMLELCRTVGLGSNVDLIFGWPCQTIDHMLRDLETVVRLGVPHLTHYELNVGGLTDFARRRRDELPSTEGNLEMYRISKQYLETSGYRQVTPYDWERIDAGPAGVLRYEVFARTPFGRDAQGGLTGYDVWDWGFAGLSRWFRGGGEPSWVVANSPHVEPYYRYLDEGRFPVERGFRYAEPDLRLYTLFQMPGPERGPAPIWRALRRGSARRASPLLAGPGRARMGAGRARAAGSASGGARSSGSMTCATAWAPCSPRPASSNASSRSCSGTPGSGSRSAIPSRAGPRSAARP